MKKIFYSFCLLLIMTFSTQESIGHPALNVKRGLEFLRKGHLEAAEKELQLARLAAPKDPVIKYNLGQVCFRRRNYAQAADFFAEAAKITADRQLAFKSLHNLGNASYRMGQYALAVDAYKRGLEIRQDARTEYNLRQAEEKLKQQMEKQQQQQQNQEQQNQQDKPSQNQDKQKSGDQKQNGEGQQSPQNSDQKDSQGNQQNAQNQGEQDQQKNNEGGQQKQDESQENRQAGKQSDEKQGNEKENGDQQAEANDESEQPREDVKMSEGGSEKDKPQESQRARALKNRKLNPYMIEKLMRQMQEREKQAQLYYRNDQPQRQEEMDPFNMDARELQEFFRNRGRKGKQKSDEPDW